MRIIGFHCLGVTGAYLCSAVLLPGVIRARSMYALSLGATWTGKTALTIALRRIVNALQGLLAAIEGHHGSSEDAPEAALTFPLLSRQRKTLPRMVSHALDYAAGTKMFAFK